MKKSITIFLIIFGFLLTPKNLRAVGSISYSLKQLIEMALGQREGLYQKVRSLRKAKVISPKIMQYIKRVDPNLAQNLVRQDIEFRLGLQNKTAFQKRLGKKNLQRLEEEFIEEELKYPLRTRHSYWPKRLTWCLGRTNSILRADRLLEAYVYGDLKNVLKDMPVYKLDQYNFFIRINEDEREFIHFILRFNHIIETKLNPVSAENLLHELDIRRYRLRDLGDAEDIPKYLAQAIASTAIGATGAITDYPALQIVFLSTAVAGYLFAYACRPRSL